MDNQNNQPFDFSHHKIHNDDNNVGKDEVIDLKELKPLNDPNCEHAFVLDGDVIGTTRAWICSKCHRGVYLPKQITKIT